MIYIAVIAVSNQVFNKISNTECNEDLPMLFCIRTTLQSEESLTFNCASISFNPLKAFIYFEVKSTLTSSYSLLLVTFNMVHVGCSNVTVHTKSIFPDSTFSLKANVPTFGKQQLQHPETPSTSPVTPHRRLRNKIDYLLNIFRQCKLITIELKAFHFQ